MIAAAEWDIDCFPLERLCPLVGKVAYSTVYAVPCSFPCAELLRTLGVIVRIFLVGVNPAPETWSGTKLLQMNYSLVFYFLFQERVSGQLGVFI